MKNISKSCILLLILMQYVDSTCGQGDSPGIKLTVEVEAAEFSPEGKPGKTIQDTLKIRMGRDGQYHMTRRSSAQDNYQDEQVLGYDGLDNYCVFYTKNDLKDQDGGVVEKNRVRSKSIHPSIVTRGSYPHHNHWTFGIPWFVYLNGQYSGNQEILEFPAPWLDSRGLERAWCFRTDMSRAAGFPHLPSKADFVFDPKLIKSDREELKLAEFPTSIESQENEFKELKKIKNSFVEARYSADSFMDIGGFHIPEKFIFAIYYSVEYGMAGEEKLFYRITGRTTSAAEDLSSETYLPAIDGIVHASDQRFRYKNDKYANDWLKNPITNQVWKTREEVQSMPEYSLSLQIPISTEEGNRFLKVNGIVRTVLLLGVILVTIIWFKTASAKFVK
jgi:hypothetical protein